MTPKLRPQFTRKSQKPAAKKAHKTTTERRLQERARQLQGLHDRLGAQILGLGDLIAAAMSARMKAATLIAETTAEILEVSK